MYCICNDWRKTSVNIGIPYFYVMPPLLERLRGPLHGHKIRRLGLMHCYPMQPVKRRKKRKRDHIVLSTHDTYARSTRRCKGKAKEKKNWKWKKKLALSVTVECFYGKWCLKLGKIAEFIMRVWKRLFVDFFLRKVANNCVSYLATCRHQNNKNLSASEKKLWAITVIHNYFATNAEWKSEE